MSTTEVHGDTTGDAARIEKLDMKLEVVVIPVADVDRAKEFYGRLGWRLDATPPRRRAVHAARVRDLGSLRPAPHLGRAGVGQGVPGRLRHRGGP
jgi:catechol 2,3-dioxygenase-like lactoylglutathione lyase family enzyme